MTRSIFFFEIAACRLWVCVSFCIRYDIFLYDCTIEPKSTADDRIPVQIFEEFVAHQNESECLSNGSMHIQMSTELIQRARISCMGTKAIQMSTESIQRARISCMGTKTIQMSTELIS
jgi:hypothetical protein